jgi:hypothetical protein
MNRLTKIEIERLLLTGAAVPWTDATGKPQALLLDEAVQRRLFAFLLASRVRTPIGLPADFVGGLEAAFDGVDDPAQRRAPAAGAITLQGPWRLHSVAAEGFGGLNTWKGTPFVFELDSESFLLEGPNGSGKSSLVGAILWALTGERPRDQSTVSGYEAKPVFSASDRPVGEWPPIACYPANIVELRAGPAVKVLLTFRAPNGDEAYVERRLTGNAISETRTPGFAPPPVLIETGLVMPARLIRMRLDGGGGRLTDAVQTLTGLDDLIAMALLAEGLCHKSREYRAYRAKDLVGFRQEFNQALANARALLAPVEIIVPSFKPSDTDKADGEMAGLGKTLIERASQLAGVVSSDLAANLNLSAARVQNDVAVALASARTDITASLQGLALWASLKSVAAAIDEEKAANLQRVIAMAEAAGKEALTLLRKSRDDSRFQLKAVAARWHAEHASGPISDCPLCQHSLTDRSTLASELEALRSAAAAAARTFDDNVNATMATLDNALPHVLRKLDDAILRADPRTALISTLRAKLVTATTYATYLVRLAELMDAALKETPAHSLDVAEPVAEKNDTAALKPLTLRIADITRLIALAWWFRRNAADWENWWQVSCGSTRAGADHERSADAALGSAGVRREALLAHLDRVSDALSKSGRTARVRRQCVQHGRPDARRQS